MGDKCDVRCDDRHYSDVNSILCHRNKKTQWLSLSHDSGQGKMEIERKIIICIKVSNTYSNRFYLDEKKNGTIRLKLPPKKELNDYFGMDVVEAIVVIRLLNASIPSSPCKMS